MLSHRRGEALHNDPDGEAARGRAEGFCLLFFGRLAARFWGECCSVPRDRRRPWMGWLFWE